MTVRWWSLYASVSTLATTRASKFRHHREELGLKPEEDLDVMSQLWNLKEDIRKHLPKQDHKSQEKTRVARQYTIGGASWWNAGRIVNAGSEHMTNVQEAEYKQVEVNLWLSGLQKRLEDLHIKVRTSRSWVPGMEPIRRFFERHYSKYQRLRADEATQMIEEEKENVKEAVEKLYKALRFAKIDLEAGLPPPEKPNPFHLMIYLVFCVIGVVGHAALVVRAEQAESIDQNRLQSVNLAFGFIIALSTVPGFLEVWLGASEGVAGILLGFFSWIVSNLFIFTTFWSDWLLAVIADDLVGIPSGDVAPMYWVSRFSPSPAEDANAVVDTGLLCGKETPILDLLTHVQARFID